MKFILLISFFLTLFCNIYACEKPYEYFETFYKLIKKKQPIPQEIIKGLVLKKRYDNPDTIWPMFPIGYALRNQHYGALQQLIDAGSDLIKCEPFQYNILHFAVIRNDITALKILIKAPISINALTSSNWQYRATALHMAAQASPNGSEIFDLLVQAGADIEIEDTLGKTPLDYLQKEKIA
jgi:ankyrin repeat protein